MYIVSDRKGKFVETVLRWPVLDWSDGVRLITKEQFVMTTDRARALRFEQWETFTIARTDNGLYFDDESKPMGRPTAGLAPDRS
jgi:hypothetical protein